MTREPIILAFCCHYCAYAAADLAGSMRLQYPGNVRVLRFPCTGKIEPNYILTAFERGVDGVMVAGCLEGGCHFLEGNLRARRRIERVRQLLDEIGIEPERLEMFNLSSAEGPRFAAIGRNQCKTKIFLKLSSGGRSLVWPSQAAATRRTSTRKWCAGIRGSIPTRRRSIRSYRKRAAISHLF